MSLIARCPACATLFRVVPDQLKISDGWVRCGQCSEVFDATLTLQEASTPVVVPPQAPPENTSGAPSTAPSASPLAENPESDESAVGLAARESALGVPETNRQPQTGSDGPSLPEASGAVSTEAEPALSHAVQAQADPDPRSSLADEPAQATNEPAEPVLEPGPLAGDAVGEAVGEGVGTGSETKATDSTPPPDASAETPAETPLDAPADTPATDVQDLAFVRQARRRAFWGRRGVRVTMGVTASVLALLLTGQVVFHHRDRLASQVPALQPALAAMCASFQCRLGPPRRIESIAIESSAFTRVRADAFRLSLTLSNQADMSVATPALELTLTDLQDQPVLRRVLQPSDLGADAPQAIAPRTEWTSTLTLAVAPAANPARIVGYRVLAFYP